MAEKEGRTVHRGTKSWWDGTVTTLCGQKFETGDRVLFARAFGYDICETCVKLDQAKKGGGS